MEPSLINKQKGPTLTSTNRLVVKIGSALLVEERTGEIQHKWLNKLADDIANLKSRGKEVLIVSSGAIAVGSQHLGINQQILKLEEKQAAAATGQIRLAHAYETALARHSITVAQILLSPSDTEERRRHLNARATLTTLLRLGVIPVINENDTITTKEIRFGDNDRLGARVAQMISADTLILLSDVDGLYEQDPRKNPRAKHIKSVGRITPEIIAMAGVAGTDYASGGMITKLDAAKIATSAGCQMAIVAGNTMKPLKALENGARCTWFKASSTPRGARKSWIASAINPNGSIFLDEGAIKALYSGRSILPAGILEVMGSFKRGDLVTIHGAEGNELAKGLVAYSASDAIMIKGHKSKEIEGILGYRGRDELIHRDDLVLNE